MLISSSRPNLISSSGLLSVRAGHRSGLGQLGALGQLRLGKSFHPSPAARIDLATVLEPIHTTLQYAHSLGLPWYAVIPLTAIAFRGCITLPIAIANRLRSQKQVELQPLLAGSVPILKARLAGSKAAQSGQLTKDQIELLTTKERRRRRVELFRKYKCQSWKSLVFLPSVQIPLWISVSFVIRAMCGWTAIPGIPLEEQFREESLLWLNGLTLSDPYGVLPIAIGVVSLANMEWNAKNINTAAAISKQSGLSIAKILSNLSRVGVLFFMSITFQAPAALCLYWLASNTFSLIQNMLLDKFLPLRYVPPAADRIKPLTEIDSTASSVDK
ncbi:cytochrome c oxidase assembly protein Cox18p, mitochondrial [Trichomonascus vanleenenianus]|uniref:membrane insertase COX18 n=1 Tax=Trichomonascus vanleenenianus TaxID=2268995 RepID=UPI003ECAB9C5